MDSLICYAVKFVKESLKEGVRVDGRGIEEIDLKSISVNKWDKSKQTYTESEA